MQKICAVVVTFNRYALLLECLEALLAQSRPLDGIYIVDNCSQDETPKYLLEKGYLTRLPSTDIKIPDEFTTDIIKHTNIHQENQTYNLHLHYVRMPDNRGGAGGFAYGMQRAFEIGYDALWLLDDDGLPESSTLARLLNSSEITGDPSASPQTSPNEISLNNATSKELQANTVYCSLVVSKQDHTHLSFGIWYKHCAYYTVSSAQKLSSGNIIPNVGNFFNSILIPRTVIAKVGFPTTKLFIWGDELDYLYRIQRNGFQVVTVVTSLHFHPSAGTQITPWKLYYMVRNSIFLIRNYPSWKYSELSIRTLIKILLIQIWKKQYTLKILQGIKDGLLGNWGKTVLPK